MRQFQLLLTCVEECVGDVYLFIHNTCRNGHVDFPGKVFLFHISGGLAW